MKYILLSILITISCAVSAQELNCNVIVDAEQVQTSERQIFTQMQAAISRFMNTRKWTSDVFEQEERISCNLVITLTSMPTFGYFEGTAQIQSTRPVYGTTYESLIFNYIDKDMRFSYTQSQPMEYSDNAYISNLTSILAFYAYVVLGYDYDSYSRKGGSRFFEKALTVVNNAQTSGQQGWGQDQNPYNRYWLADNLISPQFLPFREVLYTYHMQGMDRFTQNPDQARNQILSSLLRIKEVNKVKPNSVVLRAFFDAKSDELVNVFSEGAMAVRQNAVNLLSELDATRSNQYKKALKS